MGLLPVSSASALSINQSVDDINQRVQPSSFTQNFSDQLGYFYQPIIRQTEEALLFGSEEDNDFDFVDELTKLDDNFIINHAADLVGSRSKAQFDYRIDTIRQNQARRQRMETKSWYSPSSLLAGLIDPLNILFAVPFIGVPLGTIVKGGMGVKAAAAAGAKGGFYSAAAGEAIRYPFDDLATPLEATGNIAATTLFSSLIGSAPSAFRAAAPVIRKAASRTAEYNDPVVMGDTLRVPDTVPATREDVIANQEAYAEKVRKVYKETGEYPENRFYDELPEGTEYVDIEIVRGKVPQEPGREDYVAAKFKGKEGKIYWDEEYLINTWKEKPWSKPKVEGVEPLPDVYFQTPEEWARFVLYHETRHARSSPRPDETTPQYENRMNQEALALLAQGNGLKSNPLNFILKTPIYKDSPALRTLFDKKAPDTVKMMVANLTNNASVALEKNMPTAKLGFNNQSLQARAFIGELMGEQLYNDFATAYSRYIKDDVDAKRAQVPLVGFDIDPALNTLNKAFGETSKFSLPEFISGMLTRRILFQDPKFAANNTKTDIEKDLFNAIDKKMDEMGDYLADTGAIVDAARADVEVKALTPEINKIKEKLEEYTETSIENVADQETVDLINFVQKNSMDANPLKLEDLPKSPDEPSVFIHTMRNEKGANRTSDQFVSIPEGGTLEIKHMGKEFTYEEDGKTIVRKGAFYNVYGNVNNIGLTAEDLIAAYGEPRIGNLGYFYKSKNRNDEISKKWRKIDDEDVYTNRMTDEDLFRPLEFISTEKRQTFTKQNTTYIASLRNELAFKEDKLKYFKGVVEDGRSNKNYQSPLKFDVEKKLVTEKQQQKLVNILTEHYKENPLTQFWDSKNKRWGRYVAKENFELIRDTNRKAGVKESLRILDPRKDAQDTVNRIVSRKVDDELLEVSDGVPNDYYFIQRRTLDIPEYKIVQFLRTDMSGMFQYFATTGRRAEWSRVFGRQSLDDLLNEIEKQGKQNGNTAKEIARYKADFKTDVERIFRVQIQDPTALNTRFANGLRKITSMTYLPQTAVTSVSELGIFALERGIGKNIAPLIDTANYPMLTQNRKDVSKMLYGLDLASNLDFMTRRVDGDHLITSNESMIEKGLERMQGLYFNSPVGNFLGAFTKQLRLLNSTMQADEIGGLALSVAKTGKLDAKDAEKMSRLGLEIEDLAAIGNLKKPTGENIIEAQKIKFGNFHLLNTSEWPLDTLAQRELYRKVQTAINLQSQNTILMSQAMDRPAAMDGVIYFQRSALTDKIGLKVDPKLTTDGVEMVRFESGAMTLPYSLLSWSVAATSRLPLAMVDPARKYRIQGALGMLGFAYFSLHLQKPDWWFETKDKPELFQRIVERSGVLGVYSDIYYMALQNMIAHGVVDKDNPFLQGKYNASKFDAATEPLGAPFGQMTELTEAIYELMTGDGDFAKVGKQLPFQGTPIIGGTSSLLYGWVTGVEQDSQALIEAEQDIGTAFRR